MSGKRLNKKAAKTRGHAPNAANRCFLCGAEDAFETRYMDIASSGHKSDIQFCKACGLGRTRPFPTPEELNRLYSSTAYREDDARRFFWPFEKLIAITRGRRGRSMDRFMGNRKGLILDVGCGRGDFLAMMAERGWKTIGLELDQRIAARGKRLSLDLRYGSLVTSKFPDDHFDAITLWHVFEHLRAPDETLKEAFRVLKQNGLLLIAVPNAASLQARSTGRHWLHLDPPFHLYHYSPSNLGALLKRHCFEVRKTAHFSFEQNPFGWIQSIYNLIGMPRNFLYDLLRSKKRRDLQAYFYLFLTAVAMTIVLPASILLSVVEAALRMGGTIEVYAVKKG